METTKVEITSLPHVAQDVKVGVFAWFLDAINITCDNISNHVSEETSTTLFKLDNDIRQLELQRAKLLNEFYQSVLYNVSAIALEEFPDKGKNTQKERVKQVIKYFAEVNPVTENSDTLITSGEELVDACKKTLIWYEKAQVRIERKQEVEEMYNQLFKPMVDKQLLKPFSAYRLAVEAYYSVIKK